MSTTLAAVRKPHVEPLTPGQLRERDSRGACATSCAIGPAVPAPVTTCRGA